MIIGARAPLNANVGRLAPRFIARSRIAALQGNHVAARMRELFVVGNSFRAASSTHDRIATKPERSALA
jgi:hypothetical protein